MSSSAWGPASQALVKNPIGSWKAGAAGSGERQGARDGGAGRARDSTRGEPNGGKDATSSGLTRQVESCGHGGNERLGGTNVAPGRRCTLTGSGPGRRSRLGRSWAGPRRDELAPLSRQLPASGCLRPGVGPGLALLALAHHQGRLSVPEEPVPDAQRTGLRGPETRAEQCKRSSRSGAWWSSSTWDFPMLSWEEPV